MVSGVDVSLAVEKGIIRYYNEYYTEREIMKKLDLKSRTPITRVLGTYFGDVNRKERFSPGQFRTIIKENQFLKNKVLQLQESLELKDMELKELKKKNENCEIVLYSTTEATEEMGVMVLPAQQQSPHQTIQNATVQQQNQNIFSSNQGNIFPNYIQPINNETTIPASCQQQTNQSDVIIQMQHEEINYGQIIQTSNTSQTDQQQNQQMNNQQFQHFPHIPMQTQSILTQIQPVLQTGNLQTQQLRNSTTPQLSNSSGSEFFTMPEEVFVIKEFQGACPSAPIENCVMASRSGVTEEENHEGQSMLFKCTLCEKSYNRKSELSRHVKSHGGSSYKCDICGRMFAYKYSVKLHKNKHFGTTFACPYCPKKYSLPYSVQRHVKQVHK